MKRDSCHGLRGMRTLQQPSRDPLVVSKAVARRILQRREEGREERGPVACYLIPGVLKQRSRRNGREGHADSSLPSLPTSERLAALESWVPC